MAVSMPPPPLSNLPFDDNMDGSIQYKELISPREQELLGLLTELRRQEPTDEDVGLALNLIHLNREEQVLMPWMPDPNRRVRSIYDLMGIEKPVVSPRAASSTPKKKFRYYNGSRRRGRPRKKE